MSRPLFSVCPSCGGTRCTTFPKLKRGAVAWWRCLACGVRVRRAL